MHEGATIRIRSAYLPRNSELDTGNGKICKSIFPFRKDHRRDLLGYFVSLHISIIRELLNKMAWDRSASLRLIPVACLDAPDLSGAIEMDKGFSAEISVF
jgi:hypothetical protein